MNSLNIKLIVGIIVTLLFANVVQAQDTKLQIPALEIDSEIISLVIRDMGYGTTWDTTPLSQNIGYFTGTGWFGQQNNTVLGGHSDSVNRTPEVFYNLDKILVGDAIYVSENNQEYTYIVASVELVDVYNLDSIRPTQHEQLTIITCDLASFDGQGYQKRLVVRALPA